jgi:hypothetical protein
METTALDSFQFKYESNRAQDIPVLDRLPVDIVKIKKLSKYGARGKGGGDFTSINETEQQGKEERRNPKSQERKVKQSHSPS